MLSDYDLRGLLREAAIGVEAAIVTLKMLFGMRAEHVRVDSQQAIIEFLEKAAEDLETVTSARRWTGDHTDIVFPTEAMALSAIERLQLKDISSVQVRRDGEGRCLIRIWFAATCAE